MESYSAFANVYDCVMDNIPYKEWCEYIVEILKKYGINEGILLDLGCGTGNMTQELFRKGYDMIGIDSSEEMLSVAMEKRSEEGESILYLLQDMREIELYGTVAAVISVCDSMNYILTEEDMIDVFQNANNYLDPKGIFLFDLKTEYYYKEVLGDKINVDHYGEGSLIWENYYDEEEALHQYDLTIYKKTEQDLYERFEEQHFQKVYSLEMMKKIIEAAGMEYVVAWDAFTTEPPREESSRIYVVAREKTQDHKYYAE